MRYGWSTSCSVSRRAVASALTIPDLSSPSDTSSSVPARAPGLDPLTNMIARLVQLFEKPVGLRPPAPTEAVDDVVDDLVLDEDFLDALLSDFYFE